MYDHIVAMTGASSVFIPVGREPVVGANRNKWTHELLPRAFAGNAEYTVSSSKRFMGAVIFFEWRIAV